MNASKHDPLLKELLSGEEAEVCRAASLEKLLAVACRRRRQRQSLRIAVMVAAPVLLALGLVATHRPNPASEPAARVPPSPEPATAANQNKFAADPSETIPVRYVTDDELLGLFPDRPVALIGAPGHQTFVLLDEVCRPPGS